MDITKLSDAEVLILAGPHGPAIIGQELFDRAQQVRRDTNDGILGPALIDPDYGLNIAPWDEYSRRELLVIAREHELPVKSNASREDIAKALVRAKLAPKDPADSGNGGGNSGDEGEE